MGIRPKLSRVLVFGKKLRLSLAIERLNRPHSLAVIIAIVP
jgi:hypothetical protein